MKSILGRYVRIIDLINKINGWVLAILLIVMTILIFWQVMARYVIGNSLSFSEEISRFAMIWLTFLGMAYALRKGSLVKIELLPEALSGRNRVLVQSIAYSLTIIFSFFLIIYGWEMVSAVSSQTAPSTRISMFYPTLAIPIGGILLILNTTALFIEQWVNKGEMV